MPRSARIDIPNLLQHVIVRGIERRKIFTDDEDRHQFVHRFSQLLLSTGTDCLAWALIDNHFHLLLRPREIPLANFMRRLLTGYAVTFNLRHQRSGHLFQIAITSGDKTKRCTSSNWCDTSISTPFALVRSRPWRSSNVILGAATRSSWAKGSFKVRRSSKGSARFGKATANARQRYRLFVQDGIAMGRRNNLVGSGRPWPQAASGPGEERELRDARVLGGGGFVEDLLRKTEVAPLPAKVSLEEILTRVCGALDLAIADLLSAARTRGFLPSKKPHLPPRLPAGGHRHVDIARQLRLTGSAVSIACRRGREAIALYPALTALLKPADILTF